MITYNDASDLQSILQPKGTKLFVDVNSPSSQWRRDNLVNSIFLCPSFFLFTGGAGYVMGRFLMSVWRQ